MSNSTPSRKRRESYEDLYGLRFPNSTVVRPENDHEHVSSSNSDSAATKSDVSFNGKRNYNQESLKLTCNFISDMSHFTENEEPSFKECCFWMSNRFFTRRKLLRLCPPLTWLPSYSLEDLRGDLISGLSVAFTIVPQGLALASLAGLPPQYGLYTSFMGCFVYAALGTCKDMAVGPTSILSMIVLPYVMLGGPQYSILLAFFGGLLQLIAGVLNLGFIVDFISFPVISAFSFAAAISIAASQLKGFFGLHYGATNFFEIMLNFVSSIDMANGHDVVLGFGCLAMLLPLQIYKDVRFDESNIDPFVQPWRHFSVRAANFLWNLIIIGRNAFAVLVGSLIAIQYGQLVSPDGIVLGNKFTLTRKITPGIPAFELPPLDVVTTNGTNEIVLKSFQEVFSDISTGIVVVSLLGLMECVAVSNAFRSGSDDRKLDATQEMIALGVSNILGSCVGAFPATGSFSRSAVNHNSGVRTPLGGVVTGTLVLLALSTFSAYFETIPETVLATIIIVSVIFMAHPADVFLLWRTNRIDLLPYSVTFISALLLGLDKGIIIGISVSISILLYHMARPYIFMVVKRSPDGYPFFYVKPDRSIFFCSVEYMKIKINQNLKRLRHSNKQHHKQIVVVDGEHMFRTDSTFALVSLWCLASIVKWF